VEPATLLLLSGAAVLWAKSKKKPTATPPPKQPPSCPVGFAWDENERACVPTADGPPQILVTGMCEAWSMLPTPQVWFDQYAWPALQEIVQEIDAQPDPHAQGEAATMLYGSEDLPPAVVAHTILANSPIAYASDQFPTLGLLCKLPLSEAFGPDADPGGAVPQAMIDLADYVQQYVAQAVAVFNQTGQLQFPEVSG
jgi:hypothetical protein